MADGESSTRDWALYVYFAVDVPQPQFRASAVGNLVRMATLGSSPEVAVAAQIDLPGRPTRRYILPRHSTSNSTVAPSLSIPNVNSADPRSMTDFIQWAAEKCPAQNTMIVLWGHGYGLDDYVPPGAHFHTAPRGINALKMIVPTAHPGPAPNPPARNPTGSTAPTPGVLHAYGAIFDAHSGEVTPNKQIAGSILSAVAALPAKKAAVLGWASCEMAMAEVWSEFTACAGFGIASQTPVPYMDWPLDRILFGLLQNPKADPKAVSQMVANAFLESYSREGDFVAISAVDLPQMNTLQQAVKPLAGALQDAASKPENLPPIFEARNHCPMFDPDGFIDLGCFCEFLKITMPHSAVSDACDPVFPALNTVVVQSGYSPHDQTKKLSQSTGLSVWFPSWIQNPSAKMQEKDRSLAYLDNGYPSTAFAQATGWDKFLVTIRDTARDARRWHTL